MNFILCTQIENLSLVYTPKESAWNALVGLQSHYGVNHEKTLKKILIKS